MTFYLQIAELLSNRCSCSLAYSDWFQLVLQSLAVYCQFGSSNSNNRLTFLQVQALHCIQQLSGKVRFCDGFRIAEEIRETNPSFFQLLTQYPVHYVDSGNDFMDYDIESWHVPIG